MYEKNKFRVLITGKTYPIPSKKYDELVCTGGVTEKGDFIRLYPINFRDLPYSQQYKKYQWIEIMASKHSRRDVRKESYRPYCETLETIGEPIPTGDRGWMERSKYVLKKKANSMEDLIDQQNTDNTSLGIFKPKVIKDIRIVKETELEWKPGFLAALKQARLWEDRAISKEPPRKLPYKFYFHYECEDKRCNGNHKMMIEDWEIGALFWRLVDKGETHENASQIVKEKLKNIIEDSKREMYLYVGTVLAYPKSWVIVGLYYPTLKSGVLLRQTSLGLDYF